MDILVDFVGVTYAAAPETLPVDHNRPEKFHWGGFIEGWVKGLPGMKVGGRRELIVPARLGDAGTTEIYEVDLRAIEQPAGGY